MRFLFTQRILPCSFVMKGYPQVRESSLTPTRSMAPRKIRYGLEPVRDQFIALGEDSEQFLKGLQDKHPKNCGFHARHILRQKETYHCDDINYAMGHACRYHAYDCKAIERILKAKAAPRTLESIRNEQAAEELRKTLPQIKQRSLNEYSALLGGSEHERKTAIGQPEQDQG